ncbi:hypothetical protein AQ490_16425 [Wenjunlia vitaminophila]|uniref:HTH tetR-type domain-containing protein n=1 Tax=Wenjunlia vitaminophila TaxID=76728 RepID=A0A0T6LX08_WENVI|nr:TetR/AcrR family transcriptional regulator [Wenjunlia vitaminophila]KRV50638.1 hypothetical protein AQ490_16425 [Wenjunlia vitaminophila]
MDANRNRRTRYHHGDLRNALISAATDLARTGGPEAVVLREAARRVGVSATAAYRHFDGHGDLLHAVKLQAHAGLAASMERAAAAVPPSGDERIDTDRRFRALAHGYVAFAMAEPGLFRTGFQHEGTLRTNDSPEQVRSYSMLTEALDDLVARGLMPVSRRPLAETAAWAPMHGICLLILDGPLAQLDEAARSEAVERLIDVVMGGLCRP